MTNELFNQWFEQDLHSLILFAVPPSWSWFVIRDEGCVWTEAHSVDNRAKYVSLLQTFFCFLTIKVTGCDACCAGSELIKVFEFEQDKVINWHKFRQEVKLSSHTQLVQLISKSTNTSAEVPLWILLLVNLPASSANRRALYLHHNSSLLILSLS